MKQEKNIVLGNAFSLQMLDSDADISVRTLTLEQAQNLLKGGFVSCIGHADTANVLTDMLGMPVEPNRINVRLEPDTVLVVAQIMGGRLPEGSTTLPEGFKIVFKEVSLIDNQENR